MSASPLTVEPPHASTSLRSETGAAGLPTAEHGYAPRVTAARRALGAASVAASARAAVAVLRPSALAGAEVVRPPPRERRRILWLNRSRRVLLALAGIWIIGIFDLGYTLSEWGTPDFVEMNPLATMILGGPRHIVFAFKFGSLGIGTCILLVLRRHRISELAAWMLFALKLWLGLRWWAYFENVLHHGVGPELLDSCASLG